MHYYLDSALETRHDVDTQGRIHGPKGVGTEKFRLAPSALAKFCQIYM